MFHSQLVGGASVQFKTVGDASYSITQLDVGKTLRFGQNANITIGSLSVVDGALISIENSGSFTVSLTGSGDVSVVGGTVTIPASSTMTFVKTSDTTWKTFSAGAGGGSGSGVTYKGTWNMAPEIDNVEQLDYVINGGVFPESVEYFNTYF